MYGLAERCIGKITLENTIDWEPYRLWTADHYSGDLDRSSMYGVAPMIIIKKEGQPQIDSMLWANSSDTFVDLFDDPKDSHKKIVHWMSESGALTFFLLSSKNPQIHSQKLIALTGTPQLPPLYALGYHQCRWNYKDQDDIVEVSKELTRSNIPCDTLWLDIEYSDAKRYLSWDQRHFSNPRKMLDDIVADQRRLVTIIDPHMKKDENFFMYSQGKKQGILV